MPHYRSDMSDDKSTSSRDSYEFFLSERNGIPFEQLAAFAQPLLELFDVDPHHWKLPKRIPAEAELLDSYSSALAAAEVFWSYFTLDIPLRKKFTPELRAYFVGDDPAPHEEADFSLLISCMEEQWLKVTGGRPVPAPLGSPIEFPVSRDEPEQLEVLALFGEPLLEDPECLSDPDKLEFAMERINAYWRLAHTEKPAFNDTLDEIVKAFSRSGMSDKEIRDEALLMVERYTLLFRDDEDGRNT
ncbi:MAG: hypothetical protein KDD65_17135 [Bacteroidetes bacterium]|nr:hypothetical protein [Bacteroidota bacterium]